MSKTVNHNVVVQKDITLATGESIGTYTQKIRDAGTKWLRQKLNLVKDSGCYPVEIFSKSIIFSVYQYGPSVDEQARNRYFAAAYTRKDDGAFEFSTMTEVEQVVGYQPKDSTSVVKALDQMPGWSRVAKSLWNGVL